MALSVDTAILGGGVIGLTTAYLLAKEGVRVAILERGKLGSEASWAGAGIISPGNPSKAKPGIDSLRAISSNYFPDLSRELRELTWIDNGYIRCGILDLEPPTETRMRSWIGEGIGFEKIDPSPFNQTLSLFSFPNLSAVYLPDGAQVCNPQHLRALKIACTKLKISFYTQTSAFLARDLTVQRPAIELICPSDIKADKYIICGGAWTNEMLDTLGVDCKIFPVRGQIVLLKQPERTFSPVVEWGKRYLVPRADGHVLIGSTEEPEAGFQKANTAEGVQGLLNFALNLVPSLKDAHFEDCWSGLRPGSADGLPTIGPVPGYGNLFVGAGHGRAGIQQSIATAMILRDLALGRKPMTDISAFRVDRPRGEVSEPLFQS